MSLSMTAPPLELHAVRGYDLADTTLVIQTHVIAMFVPSLFFFSSMRDKAGGLKR